MIISLFLKFFFFFKALCVDGKIIIFLTNVEINTGLPFARNIIKTSFRSFDLKYTVNDTNFFSSVVEYRRTHVVSSVNSSFFFRFLVCRTRVKRIHNGTKRSTSNKDASSVINTVGCVTPCKLFTNVGPHLPLPNAWKCPENRLSRRYYR